MGGTEESVGCVPSDSKLQGVGEVLCTHCGCSGRLEGQAQGVRRGSSLVLGL